MLEALAKDALINLQGLLPSSLTEQPSSNQAQGGGMTSPRSPMAQVAGLGMGLLSPLGAGRKLGCSCASTNGGTGAEGPHSVPAAGRQVLLL